jgi:hypothetical protein
VVEGRTGIPPERVGDLLVGQGVVETETEDAQAERVGQGLGLGGGGFSASDLYMLTD